MSELSRRQMIRYGGSLIGTGFAATVLGSQMSRSLAGDSPAPVLAQNKNLSPDGALAMLMQGNQRFVAQKRQNPNQDANRLAEVAESQSPFAAILGCADSRVPSAIVFDRGLGDLFVCQVAGNIATSEEIGSLEFGTMVLGARVIVVLGKSDDRGRQIPRSDRPLNRRHSSGSRTRRKTARDKQTPEGDPGERSLPSGEISEIHGYGRIN
jgi:carbonic anhydrase